MSSVTVSGSGHGWRQRLVAFAIATVVMLTALPGAASAAEAPRVAAALSRTQAQLDSAREELADLERRISDERRQLADRSKRLRDEIAQLEAQLAAGPAADSAEATEPISLDDLCEQLAAMLADFRRGLETRLSAPEAERLVPALTTIDHQLAEASETARLAALPQLVRISEQQQRDATRAVRFKGQALDTGGKMVAGHFVVAGPNAYFAADLNGPAGLAVQQPGNVLPTIFDELPGRHLRAVRQLVDDGEARVPVDVSGGAAVSLQQARDSLADHLRKGGIIMLPLLALAVGCGILAIYKFLSLLFVGTRGVSRRILGIIEALESRDCDGAMAMATRLGRPLAPVIAAGISHRDAPKEHLEEIMYERILAQVPALERLLTPLAVCASVAPLLGLLGTVTGMIHTFKLITVFGTGDAKLLSSGISEALITTEVGLMIAIPALLVHAYLARRVRQTIATTQQASVMFVNGLKLHGREADIGPTEGDG